MVSTRSILERNLPGIPSQRTRRAPRMPVAAPVPARRMPPAEIPVSDTYADGEPAGAGRTTEEDG